MYPTSKHTPAVLSSRCSSRSDWSIRLCGLIAALAVPWVTPVKATDWTFAGTGDWFEAGNWADGIPTFAESAYIGNGGTVWIDSPGAAADELVIANSGSAVVVAADGALSLNGALSFGTGTGTRTLQIGDGGAAGTVTIASPLGVTTESGGSGRVVFNHTDADYTFGANITGADGDISVLHSGSGTTKLTGANTYSGGTTIEAGLIEFSSAANLGTGNITLDGGGLRWAGGNTTDISGRLNAIGSNDGIFDTNGNDVTLAGDLSGERLIKTGAGTLTLSGANSQNGFAVENGVLVIASTGAAGISSYADIGYAEGVDSTIRVNAGVTLEYGVSVDYGARLEITEPSTAH